METLIESTLEQNIQRYFGDEGFDISYTPGFSLQPGLVQNRWGTIYTVEIQRTFNCYDPVWGDHSFLERRIILQEPCSSYDTMTYASSNEEIVANVLAHQLGHADTYGLSIAIGSAILIAGVKQSVSKRSFTPLAYSAMGYALWRVVGDELLAETAASLFHRMPFFRDVYVRLPDIGGLAKAIVEGIIGLVS